jgi:four helix bundle protein
MATYRRFEDLPVWQKARILAKEADFLIHNSRIQYNFKLKDQISSSSGSIMDNIAEGFERGGNREFISFLSISKGSCGEFRSQMYRCLDGDYIRTEKFEDLKLKAEIISSELEGLINYLNFSEKKGHKFANR